jgi:hypothetical protein
MTKHGLILELYYSCNPLLYLYPDELVGPHNFSWNMGVHVGNELFLDDR